MNPTPRDTNDEEEIAACVATVYAFMRTELASAPLGAKCSPWASASRLESTHFVSGRVNCRLGTFTNLWKLTTYPMVFWILAVSLVLSALNLSAEAASLESQVSPIRVLILENLSTTSIGIPDGAMVSDVATAEVVACLPSPSTWTLSLKPTVLALTEVSTKPPIIKVGYLQQAPPIEPGGGHGLTLPLNWNTSASAGGYLIVPISPDGLIAVNDKLYRGMLWVKPLPTTLFSIINIVDLEDYLLSVLPSEMPSNWPIEALKAQAIAARSYAIASLGKHEPDGFDVKASVEDQVYRGETVETQATTLAVAQTRGLVVKHEGRVIPAFFHSTSGGFTEYPEFVWNKHIPYLQSVPDYDDQSPYLSWSRSFNAIELEESLNKHGLDVGEFLGLWVISHSPTMRARDLVLTGTLGARIVKCEDLRCCLKLPSTSFNVSFKGATYLFVGRGYGHGLGLSQWGAKCLAESGYNAAQILTYYYKDVSLDYL